MTYRVNTDQLNYSVNSYQPDKIVNLDQHDFSFYGGRGQYDYPSDYSPDKSSLQHFYKIDQGNI